MRVKEYVKLAMVTNDGNATKRALNKLSSEEYDVGGVLNGCLGLSGEAGETLDMIKKWVFREKELDVEHLKKELGDVMWYMAMLCHSMGFDLDEILQMNIEKLRARYPQGFDVVRANNRKEGDV